MSRPRVLVAEDNRVTSSVIVRQLKKLGYDAVPAYDGAAALAKAEAGPFDLIFSDEQMPRMNGREFVRAARALPHHRDTPIVFCTAKGFELDGDELRDELRVEHLLIKPFSPIALGELAESLLPTAGV